MSSPGTGIPHGSLSLCLEMDRSLSDITHFLTSLSNKFGVIATMENENCSNQISKMFASVLKEQLHRTSLSNFFERKIVIIFLSISVLGAQKNRLIEMVLLSTHNICFH